MQYTRLARAKQSEPDAGSIVLKKQIEQEHAANKEQKEKQKADALWASFMADVTTSPKTKQNTTSSASSNIKTQVTSAVHSIL